MKKTGTNIAVLFFSVCVLLTFSRSEAVTLDTSFGTSGSGVTLTDFMVGNDQAYALAVQEDGKILAAGYTNAGQETENTNIALVRYTSSGGKDTSFGVDGEAVIDLADNDAALAIALQTDGQVLLAGYATSNGREEIALIRLSADGFNDAAFQNTAETTLRGLVEDKSVAYGVAVQEDGKIVVAGRVGEEGSKQAFVLRLNEDGSSDNSFGNEGISIVAGEFQSAAKAILLGEDGTILLAGWKQIDDKTYASLFSFSTAGDLDSGFGNDGIASLVLTGSECMGNAIALQEDGKIILAGYADDGSGKEMFLARYDTVGVLDAEFGTGGLVIQDLEYASEVYDVAIGIDGIIYAAGYGSNTNNLDVLLAQVDADGNLVSFSMTPASEGDDAFGDATISVNSLEIDEGSLASDDSAQEVETASGVRLTEVGASDDIAQALKILEDGAVLAAGSADNGDNADFALIRFAGETGENRAATFVTTTYYRIATTDVTNITRNSAMTGGTVEARVGNAPGITARGVVFSIVPYPVYRETDDSSDTTSTDSTDDNSDILPESDDSTDNDVVRSGRTSDGTGTGQFGSDLYDITPDIKYYVRAYAVTAEVTETSEDGETVTTSSQVIYGNQLVFKTRDACFIATAAYGSILHKHVQVLRQFRDAYLKGNPLGEKFIGWYYSWSPSAAAMITDNTVLRNVVRFVLLPLVGLSHFMLYAGLPLTILVMVGFLLLSTFAVRYKLMAS